MNEQITSPHLDNLRMYVNDVIGVERDVLSALNIQLEDDRLKDIPSLAALLQRLARESELRLAELKQISEEEGGSIGAVVKEAAMSVAGTIAGIYGKFREHPISRMVRDDRIAMNVTETSYAMLYTLALGVGHERLATLALRGMNEAAPGVLDLTDLLPGIVLVELHADGPLVNPDVETVVRDAIKSAWSC